jgi:hypothetical protein
MMDHPWEAFKPLGQKLAQRTVSLTNKEAFYVIREELINENIPDLTSRQRSCLEQFVWEIRAKLKSDRRRSALSTRTATGPA